MIDSIGVIVASIVAIYGINAWRRELRGKREYELAEEVLALFYDCKDRLRAIRSPYSTGDEGSTRKANPNETEEEKWLYDRAYIVFERFEANKEQFIKLYSLRYRVMALFGAAAAQPIENLRQALNRVFVSAQMLPHYWRRQGRAQIANEEFKKQLKEMRNHESIFWGTFNDKDDFDKDINKMVADMESICEKIIRPEPNWIERLLKW